MIFKIYIINILFFFHFKVLCEQRFDWVPASDGYIPEGAVEGGRTAEGEPLYIGRAFESGSHTVGKVREIIL